MLNEQLVGVATSEPRKVSARIGAGCAGEGKARPARCGVRLSCCLHSVITLLDLCMACFGVCCGQAARAPVADGLKPAANCFKRAVLHSRIPHRCSKSSLLVSRLANQGW